MLACSLRLVFCLLDCDKTSCVIAILIAFPGMANVIYILTRALPSTNYVRCGDSNYSTRIRVLSTGIPLLELYSTVVVFVETAWSIKACACTESCRGLPSLFGAPWLVECLYLAVV